MISILRHPLGTTVTVLPVLQSELRSTTGPNCPPLDFASAREGVFFSLLNKQLEGWIPTQRMGLYVCSHPGRAASRAPSDSAASYCLGGIFSGYQPPLSNRHTSHNSSFDQRQRI